MIRYDDIWVWLLASSRVMTAQWWLAVLVMFQFSESSDSEQPTKSSDLPSTASSSLPSAGPIWSTVYVHCKNQPSIS